MTGLSFLTSELKKNIVYLGSLKVLHRPLVFNKLKCKLSNGCYIFFLYFLNNQDDERAREREEHLNINTWVFHALLMFYIF